jgi:hypothetical protein
MKLTPSSRAHDGVPDLVARESARATRAALLAILGVISLGCVPATPSSGIRWGPSPVLNVPDPCTVSVAAVREDAGVTVTLRPGGPLCLGLPQTIEGGQLPGYFILDDPCTPRFSVEPAAGATSLTTSVPGTCAQRKVRLSLRLHVGEASFEGTDVPWEMSATTE